jgi:hypothetical protein
VGPLCGDAIGEGNASIRPKSVGGAFPVERPVRTCKRSLAKQGLKAKHGDCGHSRVANDDPDKFEGQRLHLAVANWRYRPRRVAQLPEYMAENLTLADRRVG